MSSLVLAAWVASGVAAPCLAPLCGGVEREPCCCGDDVQCCCRLEAHSAPAPAAELIPTRLAPDPVSLPAAEGNPCVCRNPAQRPAVSLSGGPVANLLPIYLTTHAIRC